MTVLELMDFGTLDYELNFGKCENGEAEGFRDLLEAKKCEKGEGTLFETMPTMQGQLSGFLGDLFNINDPHSDNTDEGTNRIPLCQLKDDQVRKFEDGVFKLAYLGLVMTYAGLYGLLSANVRGKANYSKVMTGIHIWSMLILSLVLASLCVRRSGGTLKITRIITSGLLFLSATFLFVLLQTTL